MEQINEKNLTEVVRYDDLLQAAMMSTGAGAAQFQMIGEGVVSPFANILQSSGYQVLSDAYECNGLFAAFIDRPSEDAMSAGFEYHEDAPDIFKEEIVRLELDEICVDAMRFARLHGGAIVLPVYVGQSVFSTPLHRSRNKQIEYFEVISIDRLSVDTIGADGMPLIYNVQSLLNRNGENGQFKLHASRCVYVSGRRRPYRQTDTELIWPGVSEGSRCLKDVTRLTRGFNWSERALERKQQGVFKMQGLGQIMQMGETGLVSRRLNLVDTVRGMLNTIAIDQNDEYELTDANLSSISDILDSNMQAFAAVSGIPITVLFGRRTTSLNASGDGDTDTYYRTLNKLRTTLLRNPLADIVSRVAEYLGVPLPTDGKPLLQAAKLDTLSEFEQSQVNLNNAQALKARTEAVLSMVTQEQPAAPAAPAKPTAAGKSSTPVAAAKPTQIKPELITPDEAKKIIKGEDL